MRLKVNLSPEDYKDIKSIKSQYITQDITLLESDNSFLNIFELCKNCSKLKMIPKIDYSKVQYMSSTFYNCSELKNLSQYFLVDNVIDASKLFYNCSSLSYVPKLNFKNLKQGNHMFYNCKSLRSVKNINLNSKYNFSLNSAFESCINLKEINLNLDNCINLNSTFKGCTSISEIFYFNSSNISDFEHTFENCISLESLPFEIDMINCKNCDNMFTNTHKLLNYTLKNVPKELNLNKIGNANYTILNMI